MLGRKMSEESRAKISSGLLSAYSSGRRNKKQTPETISKISFSLRGNKNRLGGRKYIEDADSK